VRVKVSSVDQSSVNWVSVAPSVVLKGRFSEISGEGTVGDPASCLLELNKLENYVFDEFSLIVLSEFMLFLL
jgi:hypothetical protein